MAKLDQIGSAKHHPRCNAQNKIDVGNNMMNDGFTSRMMTLSVDNAIGGSSTIGF